MSDLVAFLTARLDEDEVRARRGNRGWFQWEPSRALREVDAKRKIIAEHRPSYPVTYPERSGQPTCCVCHDGGFDWEPPDWPCPTILALAAVYDGHPDYDAAWAPA